jgi:hypothetical protein
MKFYKAVLLVCMVAGVANAQQSAPQQPPAPSPPAVAAQPLVNADSQSQLLRILTPISGQQVTTGYVDVNYELLNPGVSGSMSNFTVQLDGQDPVSTMDTTYTFTGLTPGQHSVVVQLVDANGTPVTGGRSVVTFFATSNSGSLAPRPNKGTVIDSSERQELAPASSPLPLIAVVGFGALLGGVASALRTRR